MLDATKNKKLIVIPLLLLLVSVGMLFHKYSQTGEWFDKSIELEGGKLLTIKIENEVDINQIKSSLSKFGSLSIKQSSGFSGKELFIQSEGETEEILKDLNSLGINTEAFAVREIGPSLGESFWSQIQLGIIAAFVVMSIVVFIIFRSLGPSIALISAAIADIITVLAIMPIFGIEFSLASFAGLLMLIGYSVDTDILLTTSVLKSEEGNLTQRVKTAFKTGITMTTTTLGVLLVILLSNLSPVLSQIAAVLIIGLLVDVVYTWILNVSILSHFVKEEHA